MSTKVSRFLTLGFVFSIALVLVFSPLSFAYDVGRDVQLQGHSGFHFNGVYANPSAFSMLDNDKCIRATGTTAITSWGMITNTLSYQAGDFIQIWFSIGINAENNSSDTMIRGLTIQGSSYQTVDVSYETVNPSNGIVRITMRVKDSGTTDTFVVSTTNPFMVLYNNEYVYAGTVSVWRPIAYNFSSQDIVNAINNQNDYTQNLNSIQNGISDLKRTQEQANDDANDRYQDEKDTINDSKDEAQDSADSMDTSGFVISNPFTAFFALFTDNACVSIPTIQSWIHSTESQVCSPWRGNNVRSVLTPVFSILSTLIIVGFVIRWLSSGNKEGTIEGI